MDHESRVLDLLADWEAARAAGAEPTPETLCPDDPIVLELLRARIQRRRDRLAPVVDDVETAAVDRSAAEIVPPAPPGFVIQWELGRGGMGVVYQAKQLTLGRSVALKVLRPEAAGDPVWRARFQREAEALARCRHPNVVQVYDYGSHEGQAFVALELIDGPTLAAKLAGEPQLAQTAAKIVEQIARAVAAVHHSGVIHRDLKPGNILIAPDGALKVTDFGLAKQLGGEGITHSGAIFGTPSYMAPEQAAGQPVGPAADVYSMGAILYECLTGRPPFRGLSAVDTLLLVRSQEPIAPRQLVPTVPRSLEAICLMAMSKDPSRRYATAEMFAEDLERFLTDRPVLARPIGRVERFSKWSRRHPGRAVGLCGLIIAAVGATLASALFLQQRDRARLAERRAEVEVAQGLYFEARTLRNDAGPGARVRGLELLGRSATLVRNHASDRDERIVPYRSFAVELLPRLDLTFKRRVTLPAYSMVNYDRDLRYFSLVDPEKKIYVGALDAPDERRLISSMRADEPWAHCGFDPTGRYLVIGFGPAGQNNTVRSEVHLLKQPGSKVEWDGRVVPFGFSPDGDRICHIDSEGQLTIREVPSGKVIDRFPTELGKYPKDARFSPDGRKLAIAFHSEIVVLAQTFVPGPFPHAAGWKPLYRFAEIASHVSLTWSDDSQLLAFGSGVKTGPVHVCNVTYGVVEARLEGHTGDVIHCQFLPGTHQLASAALDNMVRFWDWSTGKQTMVTPGVHLRFDRSGRQFAVLNGKGIDLFDVVKPTECYSIHPSLVGHLSTRQPASQVRWATFSRDGEQIGVASHEGLRVYRSRDGNMERFVPFQAEVALPKEGGEWYVRGSESVFEVAADGTVRPNIALAPTDGYARLSCTADGSRIVYAKNPLREVIVFTAGREVTLPACKCAASIVSCEISPDGQWVAASCWGDPHVFVWDISNLDSVPAPRSIPALPGKGAVRAAVRFSPDGTLLGCTAMNPAGCEAVFWRVGTWDLEKTIPVSDAVEYVAPCFSADSQTVALRTSPRSITLFDVPTWKATFELNRETNIATGPYGFDPNGRRLLIGTTITSLEVWDVPATKNLLSALDLGP